MSDNGLNQEQQQIIIELYKSHFTAKETSSLTDLSYNKIAALFRGFKVAQIEKYDRLNLIQNTALLDSLKVA